MKVLPAGQAAVVVSLTRALELTFDHREKSGTSVIHVSCHVDRRYGHVCRLAMGGWLCWFGFMLGWLFTGRTINRGGSTVLGCVDSSPDGRRWVDRGTGTMPVGPTDKHVVGPGSQLGYRPIVPAFQMHPTPVAAHSRRALVHAAAL